MNKQQLVKAMAENGNMNQDTARKAIDAFELAVAQALADGENVVLVGFGTFKTTERAAYTARNPKTGEAIAVPATNRVSFTAGKNLKDAVNL